MKNNSTLSRAIGKFIGLAFVMPALCNSSFAAITFVAATSPVYVSSTTTITISAPSGIQPNDLLIAHFGIYASKKDTINTLSGWTLIKYIAGGGTGTKLISAGCFWKVATAGDIGASYTFTSTSSVGEMQGTIMAFRGVNTSTPINASSGVNGASTSIITNTITPSVANTMLVCLFSTSDFSGTACQTLTPNPPWNQLYYGSCGTVDHTIIMGADSLDASSGQSVYGAATPSAAVYYISYIIALAPAPCATPTNVNVGSITTNSASVNFTGSGNSFIVEYGAAGFTPGTGGSPGAGGTIVTGTSSPISISPLTQGTSYDVYVRQNCGGSYSANTAKVNFTTLSLTMIPFNVKFFIQGYYLGGGKMSPLLYLLGLSGNATDVDTVIIQLRNSSSPYAVAYADTGILQNNGTISCVFLAVTGNSYFIVLNHRNSLQTWSNGAQMMTSNGTYDFTTSATQAYGSNMVNLDGTNYGIYSGDVDQSGSINATDISSLQSVLSTFQIGVYNANDITGDGFVDEDDYRILQNNVPLNISVQHP